MEGFTVYIIRLQDDDDEYMRNVGTPSVVEQEHHKLCHTRRPRLQGGRVLAEASTIVKDKDVRVGRK